MEFDIPKDHSSIIKVIGVGGGGSNAVNHMYNQGFDGVDFIVCNTDRQALDISPVPFKIQLGPSLTEGRGAGSIPEIGMNAAIENIDDIRDLLSKNTKMVFVTAGMGGGTGTGAAPVIAKTARELGILTVGIVTVPFNFEGRKRRQQAEEGLESMREAVDTLLVINNERLREISGNLTLGNAFAQADDVLATAAKGIADVISVTGAINVDFNDVNTVMKDSGVAVMGSASAEGDTRAMEAVQDALSSPLLNDNDISGAEYVLLNITYGSKEVLMDEISEITDYIQDEAGSTADVIWGHGYDETLGEELSVTIIATGFNHSPVTGFEKAPQKKVQVLEDDTKKEISKPLDSAVSKNEYVEKKESEPYMKSTSTEEVEEKKEEPTSTASTMNWEVKTVLPSSTDQSSETKDDKVNEASSAKETTEKSDDVKRYFLDDEMDEDTSFEGNASSQELTQEEQQRRTQERLERIKNYTSHLNSAEGLSELERQPAFKRRKINLDDNVSSSSDSASRYEVSPNDNGNNTTLRGTNSFLHDNVD
ncbi:cell division protein FtsZ [Brumimicrobium aurantiacum]|uniref:Cell division protein FtsZ n=1 Tax=Brumimicrobium aurantiacum TaxID=1737063 RepID=A0A3E1EY01_9FLAO|nr:cell division protein FtsZ [Brumimicrobium aurantiacum]RFC54440.1 cell division protein FtsZ [Brumimicrobium aurantiacum]